MARTGMDQPRSGVRGDDRVDGYVYVFWAFCLYLWVEREHLWVRVESSK